MKNPFKLVNPSPKTLKEYVLIFLCLLSIHAIGQQEKTEFAYKDINADGVMDTLKVYSSYGTSVGGKYLTIINGASHEVFKMDFYGSFGDIRHVSVVPKPLTKPENHAFYIAMKEYLFGREQQQMDPSLAWIVSGVMAHAELKDNAYFDLIIDPQMAWVQGDLLLPDAYFVTISGDTLDAMYNDQWVEEKVSDYDQGILLYFAHNHGALDTANAIVSDDKSYTLHATEHGVYVEQNGAHKWLFVTDSGLTGAPQKLRWRSINHVDSYGKYAIIHQDFPLSRSYHIYIINIETGICGRLKHEFSSHDFWDKEDFKESYVLQGDNILLTVEGEEFQYQLTDIFDTLESQYLNQTNRKK